MRRINLALAAALLWLLAISSVNTPSPTQSDTIHQDAAFPFTTLVPTPTPTPAPSPEEEGISNIFTGEVVHWEQDILRWASEYGLDPNIIATIMQIESCGNSRAVSHAGARGLFQVMPYHFAAGEDMFDPDINAMRGLKFYASLLERSGDVALSFAAYNGGGSIFNKQWDIWPNETKRYYKWSGGIYNDIQAGLDTSQTLEEWLMAGGESLCRMAKTSQEN